MAVSSDPLCCRIHGYPAVKAEIDGEPIWVCAQCAVDGLDPVAGLGQRTSKTRQVNRFTCHGEREEQVQASIVQALLAAGYEVLKTSRVRKRCVHCGKFSSGGDGVSRGLPDLLVRNPEWPPAVWFGIEVKGGRTALSPEQQELLQRGSIVIARSVDDALAAVQAAEGQVGRYDPYMPELEAGGVS